MTKIQSTLMAADWSAGRVVLEYILQTGRFSICGWLGILRASRTDAQQP